jgi:hypothetical protein
MVIARRGATRANASPTAADTAGATNQLEDAADHARGQSSRESCEHPDRGDHGRRGGELLQGGGRDRDARNQRPERARRAEHGLRRQGDEDDPDHREGDQDGEDDGVRRRRELDREAGQQGAGPQAAGQADTAEDRAESLPVRRGEFDERRGEGGRRRAAGDTLHDAAGDHPPDVGGDEEQHVRRELDDQGSDQHRAPAHVVGQRPQGEDGDEEADRVDGERQREKRRRELPLLLIDHQQRRQRAGREIQGGERECRTRQRQSGGESAPAVGRGDLGDQLRCGHDSSL